MTAASASTESGRRREHPAEVEPSGIEDTFGELDEAFAVREVLADLPEECREVLDRFFCRDESYRTIGQELGIPSGTIASRISRCLGKLREHFEATPQGRKADCSCRLCGNSDALGIAKSRTPRKNRRCGGVLSGVPVNTYDGGRVARLLRLLRPVPQGWVTKAQRIPLDMSVRGQLVPEERGLTDGDLAELGRKLEI